MSLFVGDGLNGTTGAGYARAVPVPYARAADGGLVPEGVPYGNGPLARLWRLPTQFLPVAPALAWALIMAAVGVLAYWLRWLR